MSQVAFARFIPLQDLSRIFSNDDLISALDAAQTKRLDFVGPGNCVVTAMLFLEARGVDLRVAKELSGRITERLDATQIVLTPESKASALERIRTVPLNVAELLQFDAQLNGVPMRDPLRAEPLKAADRFFHQVLRSMQTGEVAIIEVA